ncbi:hypothetical protein ACFXPQ_21300 [Streptomyces lydicus]|uniref:hypothetical protein n=1 Tax=Streptomyces lydicus TaxID=47763 RepID=UPI003684BDAC
MNGETEATVKPEEVKREDAEPEGTGPDGHEGPEDPPENAGCGEAHEAGKAGESDGTETDTEADDEAGEATHADRDEFIPTDAKHIAQISPSCRNSGG